MSNWALTQLVAPVVEPVTLDDLKLQAHITHDIQDVTLQSYLLAGRLAAEEYQRASYITQTWRLTLDCFPSSPVKLLRSPVQSLTSVTVFDSDDNEIDVDISNFYIDTDHTPARFALKSSGSWPSVALRETGGVKIEYVCGYGDTAVDVPATVKYAIILFASFADDNRAADEAELPRTFHDLLRPTLVETNEPW